MMGGSRRNIYEEMPDPTKYLICPSERKKKIYGRIQLTTQPHTYRKSNWYNMVIKTFTPYVHSTKFQIEIELLNCTGQQVDHFILPLNIQLTVIWNSLIFRAHAVEKV